eukprot:568141-Pelagomonas_calceolata.AAC.1
MAINAGIEAARGLHEDGLQIIVSSQHTIAAVTLCKPSGQGGAQLRTAAAGARQDGHARSGQQLLPSYRQDGHALSGNDDACSSNGSCVLMAAAVDARENDHMRWSRLAGNALGKGALVSGQLQACRECAWQGCFGL